MKFEAFGNYRGIFFFVFKNKIRVGYYIEKVIFKTFVKLFAAALDDMFYPIFCNNHLVCNYRFTAHALIFFNIKFPEKKQYSPPPIVIFYKSDFTTRLLLAY